MQEEYNGFTIKIEQDIEPEDPREWDNLGTIICSHRRYCLGDEKDNIQNDFENDYNLELDDIREIEDSENVIALSIYLYDHSGITINTTGFSCPWDSGKIGFIFVTKGKIKKEYGWKRITKKRLKQIEEYLRSEVTTYDQYLTGDVYGYTITKKDEDIDSCWGYYGTEACLQEAKSIVDWHVKNDEVQLELPFVTA